MKNGASVTTVSAEEISDTKRYDRTYGVFAKVYYVKRFRCTVCGCRDIRLHHKFCFLCGGMIDGFVWDS